MERQVEDPGRERSLPDLVMSLTIGGMIYSEQAIELASHCSGQSRRNRRTSGSLTLSVSLGQKQPWLWELARRHRRVREKRNRSYVVPNRVERLPPDGSVFHCVFAGVPRLYRYVTKLSMIGRLLQMKPLAVVVVVDWCSLTLLIVYRMESHSDFECLGECVLSSARVNARTEGNDDKDEPGKLIRMLGTLARYQSRTTSGRVRSMSRITLCALCSAGCCLFLQATPSDMSSTRNGRHLD